jgi:hypothetical protein
MLFAAVTPHLDDRLGLETFYIKSAKVLNFLADTWRTKVSI